MDQDDQIEIVTEIVNVPAPIDGDGHAGIPMSSRDLERLRREVRPPLMGRQTTSPLLDGLGLDRSNWVKTLRESGRMFKQAAGRASLLARAAPPCSRLWFQGGHSSRFCLSKRIDAARRPI